MNLVSNATGAPMVARQFASRAVCSWLLAVGFLLGTALGGFSASVSWTGSGGDSSWHNPANWSGGILPGPLDDVTINLAGAAVQFSQGTATIRSLTSSRPFTISGGGLVVTNGFTLNNTTFTLSGGSLDLPNQSSLNGCAVVLQSGVVSGQLRLISSSLNFPTNASSQGTILLEANNNETGDVPPMITLLVQGNSSYGSGSLTVNTNGLNRGTILLDSTNSGYNSTLTISAGTFVNASTGVIQANPGAGGLRYIYGNVENSGTVLVASNVVLTLQDRFAQKDGVLRADGMVQKNGGSFELSGGRIEGLVWAYNSFISVADTVSQTSLLRIGGNSGILSSNASAAVTLWVEGNSSYGAAYLVVTNDAVNRGTIVLTSTNSGYNSTLTVNAGTLRNASTGVIQANAGAGGGPLPLWQCRELRHCVGRDQYVSLRPGPVFDEGRLSAGRWRISEEWRQL